MQNLTLYTGKMGHILAKTESSVWATTTGLEDDFVFTVDLDDVRQIRDGLFEVVSFDSVEWKS